MSMASSGTRQILYADLLESTIGTLLLIHDREGHVRALRLMHAKLRTEFAVDSALEEGVSSEPVSESPKFPRINRAFSRLAGN
jgi:hypothetical protein